jgi:hypothetical protein
MRPYPGPSPDPTGVVSTKNDPEENQRVPAGRQHRKCVSVAESVAPKWADLAKTHRDLTDYDFRTSTIGHSLHCP